MHETTAAALVDSTSVDAVPTPATDEAMKVD